MAYPTQLQDAGVQGAGVYAARMRFSNPDQTYSGDPLGVPGDEPSSSITGPADARRTLNETREVVANFRVAPCLNAGERGTIYAEDSVHLQASNGQFVSAKNNGGGAVRADANTPSQWETFSLRMETAGCVESGDIVWFRTSDDYYLNINYSELPYSVDADWRVPSDKSAFTIYRRGGDGTIRPGDLVTLYGTWYGANYVRAEQGGGGRLLLDSYVEGSWETFKIIVARD